MNRKDEIIAGLHRLPVMPKVVQEVMASLRSSDIDGAVLARKIARDQGLSARMLRVANSPFYGLPRRVGSVQEAVMVLGSNSIRSLVLSAGFVQTFPPVQHGAFDRKAFWKRSFRVAGYAQSLAQCLRQDRQVAFTAGMFHEIGQLVLDLCIPEQFAGLLREQAASGADLLDIERSQLGYDHAEIGAEMARRWNFPPVIEHTIRYWRMPEREPFEPVAGIVHLAALLEGGLSVEALMAHLPQMLRDRLKIDRECIEACLPERGRLDDEAGLMLGI